MNNLMQNEQNIIEEIEEINASYDKENEEQEVNHAALEEIGAIESEFYSPDIESSIKHTIKEWKKQTATDPTVSGNDVDAYWQGANFDGSETSGGSASTPDQNTVEDNARPWGIVYSPYEELNILGKLRNLEKQRRESEGRDDFH